MRHAVFIRTGALGDFILSLPLLRHLRRQYQELTLVARKRHLGLILGEGLHDRFIDADSAAAALPDAPPGADFFVFGAPDPASLAARRPGRIFWIAPRPELPPHAAARFFLDAGIEPHADLLERPLWARTPGGTALWLHPGSGGARKNCPPALFAKIAELWRQAMGGEVIVSFGEADEALPLPVKTAFAARGVDFEPVTSPPLPELKSQLATRAAFYVGNDSGVSHLAGALGVPSAALFRGSDPEVWRPLGGCQAIASDDEELVAFKLKDAWLKLS